MSSIGVELCKLAVKAHGGSIGVVAPTAGQCVLVRSADLVGHVVQIS
jgi:hypothetical protein